MNIGIMCLQGSFLEHEQVLETLNLDYQIVKTGEDLQDITHLIIPGGESTVMRKLAQMYGLWDAIIQKVQNNTLAIMGTCAGAILLQDFGMDITVQRNAYGAQAASCIIPLASQSFPDLQGCFIRAPKFTTIGDTVRVLATREDHPVMVQENRFLALTFHPELIENETRIHQYFCTI